jgi:hypothetical protein
VEFDVRQTPNAFVEVGHLGQRGRAVQNDLNLWAELAGEVGEQAETAIAPQHPDPAKAQRFGGGTNGRVDLRPGSIRGARGKSVFNQDGLILAFVTDLEVILQKPR